MKSLIVLTIGLLISGTAIRDGETGSGFTSKGDPAAGRAITASRTRFEENVASP